MRRIVGVRFKRAGKVYYFDPVGVMDLAVSDWVVVETSRGTEVGQVVLDPRDVEESEITSQLKPVNRRATSADLLSRQRYTGKEQEVVEKCREMIGESRLPMKVVGAEYSYDGSRLVVFFTSEKRVDFRQLVRDLTKVFHAHIDLRQVGPRDEARLFGGVGHCGYPLCCSSWLRDLNPVSIKMAKEQNLPLSPMEISGVCGRLLCCLNYENKMYIDAKGRLPKIGTQVETPRGGGRVVGVDVFTDSVTVRLENDVLVDYDAGELQGTEVPKDEQSRGTPRRQRGRGRTRRESSG